MSDTSKDSASGELSALALSRLIHTFTQRISNLFDQMVDTLLGMAEKSPSLNEQHKYFAAMRVLQGCRRDVIKSFGHQLELMLRASDEAAESLHQAKDDEDDLALVSDEATEESVMLASLAQRINNRAGDEVQAMAVRLESLLAQQVPNLSIGPEVALRALETSLREVSLEYETRQLVYQVIEAQSLHSLANVYAEMNQWLVAQGVMPKIPVAKIRKRHTSQIHPQQNEPVKRLMSFDPDEQPTEGDWMSYGQPAFARGSVPGFVPSGGSSSPVFASGGSNEALPAPQVATPWMGQVIRAMDSGGLGSSMNQALPVLRDYAVRDLAVFHDRRHPMRRALSMLSDLVLELESTEDMSDISEELARMIALMEQRAASGPGFWLHVIKYLQYIKEEIHNRVWGDDEVADHQTRMAIARRLATRQIQLQLRDKKVTPGLRVMLTHLLGPALAVMLLRHRHERDSAALRTTLQLIHEAIESVQPLPESVESMHYLEHASGSALLRRIRAYLGAFSGLDQTLMDQTMEQVQADHAHLLDLLEKRNSTILLSSPAVAERDPLPLPAPPPVVEETSDERTAEDISPEPPIPEPDLAALNDLRLDALLERMVGEYRFTWFQIHVCECCPLRRLMLGDYDAAKRIVVFVNVRQEPTIMLSVVDMDAGLRAGLTRPIFDDPKLQSMIEEYLATRNMETPPSLH